MTDDARVLVVDDEQDMRLIVRTLMTSQSGWHVDEAASGQEALECCADGAYDAVVLDYRMPGLTGIDVARELVSRRFDAPIVIFSAYLSRELEDEAAELGLQTVDKSDLMSLVDVVNGLIDSR